MVLRTAARETRCCPGRFTTKAKTSERHAHTPRCLGQATAPSPVTMTRSPNVREVAPMPGANDQLANTPPGVDQASPHEPDPVSPREPHPVMAELRGRM